MGIGLPSDSFRKIFFLFALLWCVALQEGYGQTDLSPGDIVIVTVNADDNDGGNKTFDFVPLIDLETGTKIKFTDAAYIEANSELDSNEGTITYTASSQVSAGSILTYSGSDEDGFVSSGSFNPAASGDNIIAFQGDTDTTYLFGVGWARGSSVWNYDPDTSPNNRSDVPSGLSETDNTILSLGTTDNYQYNEANGLEGTANSLLTKVGNENNWQEDDENAFSPFSFDFTLLNPPTVAFSSEKLTGEEETTTSLEIKLVESNGTAVDVDVAFLSSSSTATNGDDFDSYSPKTVSFSDSDGDNTTKTISIDLKEDSEFEGSEKAVFQLQNISTGTIISPDILTLTIEDDDAPGIVINEVHADPDPENGNADGNSSVDSNDDEFVEFVNTTSSDIDISGWTFSDETSLRHTFPSGTTIPADGALVLFGDDGESPQGNFGGAIVQSSNESALLSLNNGGDTIFLKDEDGNEVINLTYPNAGNDQSIVRDPEIDGGFENHSNVSSSDDLFSPGTKVNGDPFGSDHAIAFRGSEGWRMISTPTENASFSDLFGNLWMQGVSGSDDPSSVENLTLAGWSEENTTFSAPSDMNDNMTAGKGYIIYVFEDDEFNTPGIQGGFPKVISTDGNENGSTVSVTISANDSDGENGIDGDEGWNLLGNPFGTDLSVSALISALEGVDNSLNANVYVWDHDGGSGNGGYVTLEDGDRIAPFQAFFVRFTNEVNDETFTFDKNDLEANTGTEFYKNNAEDSFAFDVQLHGEEYFDTYSLEFSENGTVDLDRYDVYKLFSLNANSINLFSTHGDNRLQKNVLPKELETNLEIPLSFEANGRSNLTFRWDNIDDLPSDWDVMLIDKEENREIDLHTAEEYQFTVSSATQKETAEKQGLLNKRKGSEEDTRFVLSVSPNLETSSGSDIPESVKLNPNYPNPFNPTTTIPYEITEDAEVKLTIWNMIGQKVATLVDGMVEAGTHEETWNANNMPSGIYIARFEVGNEVFTRKMTLIK